MRVAIVDDEKSCCDAILNTIKKFYNFDIDVFCDGEEFLKSNIEEYKIIFLDIEIGSCNGITIAEKVREITKNAVIFFVTSYTSYITDALRSGPFQYIVKPVNDVVLQKELIRAMDIIKKQISKIEVSRYGEKKLIEIKDIMYIEYTYRLVSIYLADGSNIECSNKFKTFVDKLDKFDFVQCHKSYMVNLRYIESIKGSEIKLNNNSVIPSSRKFACDLKEKHRVFISGVVLW